MTTGKTVDITVLLTAGRLPLEVMSAAHTLAGKYSCGVYLSTLQNLRMTGVPESAEEEVRRELSRLGAEFKASGKVPIPRVCIGRGDCKLGIIDTEEISKKIIESLSDRKSFKGKIKIAVSACAMCCSGGKTTDIGVVATRNGYDVYSGGKGGTSPKVGRRIAKSVDEGELLDTIRTLVVFHDQKTQKKQRMFKLHADSDFPYEELH